MQCWCRAIAGRQRAVVYECVFCAPMRPTDRPRASAGEEIFRCRYVWYDRFIHIMLNNDQKRTTTS
eukprot:6351744-Prymnesium_polylepis.1